MTRNLALLAAFLVVLVGPILLRPKQDTTRAGRTVVVITPHNESIRYEFARGFEKHYLAKTGQRVRVDFRTPGGTTEITRYIDGEYLAAFQNYWRQTLDRPWSTQVEKDFMNAKAAPDHEARTAFLASDVSCKIDVFFGGGAYDFQQAAAKGQLVDCGYIAAHPELFGDGPGRIPPKLSGEPFYDPQGRWLGCVVSAFGIVSNTDALARLGIAEPPRRWADLADPRYFGEVALSNPNQSSSINKSFEMLIQQQIAAEVAAHGEGDAAIAAGWLRALRLLQRICANARYFTDSSTKPSLDIAAGDCAAGMTIDFYARFQAEAVARSGGDYLRYANAAGGTSVGVDPVALLRGAPNPDVAREFVAFVMSAGGQKLWNWKVGVPGGPEHYALRRMPILPSLYAPEFTPQRTDPDVFPYEMAKHFTYREAWTSPLFRAQSFIVRVMCIDTHDELRAAWRALIDAGFPPAAVAEFERLDSVDYAMAKGRIKDSLGPNKIVEVRLAKELADGFRAQFRRTVELARAGR
ncbi:MAG: extracellular solute-binding protein [Chthoniobacteraceae bacterium]